MKQHLILNVFWIKAGLSRLKATYTNVYPVRWMCNILSNNIKKQPKNYISRKCTDGLLYIHFNIVSLCNVSERKRWKRCFYSGVISSMYTRFGSTRKHWLYIWEKCRGRTMLLQIYTEKNKQTNKLYSYTCVFIFFIRTLY